ncbi:GNAT family N-acetyltransferase [Ligilactobacillus acidipiscis]|uniref:GNAT family N-acetyltransferase n=1 Tax=Ligilactobacillus acidipiscis TaxID=89059 RepID=UPI0023F8EA9B|nr:GNAT family protein [Ligilactobacillus acidipiscis]WEV57175.1 GNAT family protein [Ligilactobacillus acidipiscis]
MPVNGTQTLTTNRLVLRRLATSDAPAMFTNWANDPLVTKYLTWQPHQNISITEMGLKWREKQYQGPAFFDWGIVIKDTDELIGTITVVNQDKAKKTMEIGYCLGKQWWGQGFAAEALIKVLNFLFTYTAVERIEARHDTNNPNSGKVMKKAGMAFEKILYQHGTNNNGVCDEAVYSILRTDTTASTDAV